MGALELVDALRKSGIQLSVEGGRVLAANADRLTEDQRSAIRTNKAELLLHLGGRQERPYRLSLDESRVAHADSWDDATVARFRVRQTQLARHGFDEGDAEDLAERLHLRDLHADHRHLCVECRHLRSWRCGNYAAAGLSAPEVGRDLSRMFQACAGFREAP